MFNYLARLKTYFSSLLPIVAFCVSIYSLYVSETAQRDVARMEVIKTEYGLFHDLAQLQLQYPQMTHLFAVTPETYDLDVERIKVSLRAADDTKRAGILLQERALAHYLFTTYEETYYLWRQAITAGDRRKEEFAYDDLNYFNEAICSNPRLLWYWDFRGGKLDRAFAGELRDYYRKNVLKGCATTEDSAGPFGP